jgi:hypothetical protein
VRDEGMKKSFLIEFKLSFFHWLWIMMNISPLICYQIWDNFTRIVTKNPTPFSSPNVSDNGAVLLWSIIWILMFCNHNVSRSSSINQTQQSRFNLVTREEPSLETLWLQNIRTMDEVQIIDCSPKSFY